MNIIIEGTLSEPDSDNIFYSIRFSDSEELIIEINPDFTSVHFPDGSCFIGTVDFQKDFYEWVQLKPAKFCLGIDGNTTILEIDIPPQDTRFRLETGVNGCWWAGFQTPSSRFLRKYPIPQ
jgi:hypothetical protein